MSGVLHARARRTGVALLTFLTAIAFFAVLVARADASYPISSFAVTPSTKQAAAHPNLAVAIDADAAVADLLGADDLKNLVIDAPAGMVFNQAAAATQCTAAQLTADTCAPASTVGSISIKWRTPLGGSITGAGNVYVMTTPAGNGAALGIVVRPTNYKKFSITAAVTNAVPFTAPTRVSLTSIPRVIQTAAGANTNVTIDQIDVTLNSNSGSPANGPSFTLNPSSCTAATTTASFTSWIGASVTKSSSFTPTGCAGVPFTPATSVQANESTGGGSTGFNVILEVPQGDAAIQQSAIKGYSVDLARGTKLNTSAVNAVASLCTNSQLAADTCPAKSVIGSASLSNNQLGGALISGTLYLMTRSSSSLGLGYVMRNSTLGTKVALTATMAMADVTGDSVADLVRLTTTGLPQVPWAQLNFAVNSLLVVNPANACPNAASSTTASAWSSASATVVGQWFIAPANCIPDTTLTTYPPSLTASVQPSVGFTSSIAGSTFQCSWDGAAYSACTSPSTAPQPLSQNAVHSFCARAVYGGQPDPTPACIKFRVGLNPPFAPTVTRVSPTASPTNVTTQSLSISTTEIGGTLQGSLDGSAFATTTGSVSLTGLTDGTHTYSARVIDAAGNVGSVAAVTWVVDTAPPPPPVVAITSPANNSVIASATVNVAYTVNASTTIPSGTTCSVNGAASTDGNTNTVNLAVGANTITVVCTNAGGSGIAVVNVTRGDSAPPSIDGLSSTQGAAGATITYTASDNSGAAPTCTPASGTTFPFYSTANLIVSVTCLDSAGNMNTTSLNVTSNGPATGLVTSLGGPNGSTTNTAPAFTYTVNRATSGPLPCGTGPTCATATVPQIEFSCTMDGNAVTCGEGGYTSPALALGIHTFCVRARGTYSGEASAPSCRTFTVIASGGTPPVVNVTSPPFYGSTGASPMNVAYTVNGSTTIPAGTTCSINGVPSTTPTTNATAISYGTNAIPVTCTNASGSDTKYVVMTFMTGFGVAITTPAPGYTTTSSSVNVTYNRWNVGSGVTCTINGAPSTSNSTNTVALPLGTSNIDLVCSSGGNVSKSSISVTRGAAPAIAITAPANNSVVGTTTSVSYVVNGSSSIPAGTTCRVNGAPSASTTGNVVSLASGANLLTVSCSNEYGYDTATVSVSNVIVDYFPTFTGGPTGAVSSRTATFAVSGAPPQSLLRCSLDGAALATCPSPITYNNLTEGQHSLCGEAVDAASNTFSIPCRTWTVDTVAPVVTITSPTASQPIGSTTTLSFSATDSGSGVASVTCQIDAAAPVSCSSGFTYSGLAPVSHTFTVCATDFAGNTGCAIVTPPIAPIPPTVTISSPINGSLVGSTSVNLIFSTTPSSGVTTTCKLDAGTAQPCTSPTTFSGLTFGSHTITVCATDATPSTTCATTTFTVGDIHMSITSPVNGQIFGSRTVPIVFPNLGAGYTYTCKLDAAAATPCTSPMVYTNLSDGSHTVTVCASNATGTACASVTFFVDATPPSVVISSPANGQTVSSSPSVVFTVSEPASVTCRVDSSPATACTSPYFPPILGPGSHTITICATDSAGNTTCVTITFTVVAVPTVTITSPTNGATLGNSSLSATFVSTGSPVSTTCKIDSLATAACASPVNYTGLLDGSHTITVCATNAAGSGCSSVTFTVAANPPQVTITAPASGSSNGSSLDVTFTSVPSSGLTYTCKLDSGTAAACTSPMSYTGLTNGSHTVTVCASYPNGAPSCATSAFTVAGTFTPSFNQTNTNNVMNQAKNLNWTFSTPAGSSSITKLKIVEPSIVGPNFAAYGAWEDQCPNAAAPTPSSTFDPSVCPTQSRIGTMTMTTSSGTITGWIYAIGKAPIPWLGVTFDSSIPGNPAGTSLKLLATANVPQVDPTCNPDDAGFCPTQIVYTFQSLPVASPATYSTQFGGFVRTSPSSGVLQNELFVTSPMDDPCTNPPVQAVATSGATSVSISDPDEWDQCQLVSPTLSTSITAGPADGTTATTATFAFTGSAGATLECQLDGSAFAACTSPITYSGLADGFHSFCVRAASGGSVSASTCRTWAVDHTAPVISISSPANGSTTNAASVTLTYSATDIGPVTCSPTSGSTQPVVLGSNTITVSCTDGAGNVGTASTTFTGIVGPQPVPSCSGQVGSVSCSIPLTAGWTATCQLDSASAASCSGTFVASASPGSHSVTICLTSSNGTSCQSYPVTVSGVVPTVTISSPTNGFSTPATSVILNYTVSGTTPISCTRTNGSTVPIALGANTITVSCTNAAGTGSASVTVTRVAPAGFSPNFSESFSNPVANGTTALTMNFGAAAGSDPLTQLTVNLDPNVGFNFPSTGVQADMCAASSTNATGTTFDPTSCPSQAEVGTMTITSPDYSSTLHGRVWAISKSPLPWFGIDFADPALGNPSGTSLRLVMTSAIPQVDPTCDPSVSGFCQWQIRLAMRALPSVQSLQASLTLGGVTRTSPTAGELPGDLFVISSDVCLSTIQAIQTSATLTAGIASETSTLTDSDPVTGC